MYTINYLISLHMLGKGYLKIQQSSSHPLFRECVPFPNCCVTNAEHMRIVAEKTSMWEVNWFNIVGES